MQRRNILLLWVVLLVACARPGESPGPSWAFAMRDVKFPMRDFRFPSGLRVVVEADSRTPLVAVTSVVGAGSTSDPPGKEGLAHYVEHLTFRARPDGKTTVEALLGLAGAGSHNATTSFDRTVYYSIGPREALTGLLILEAERILHPLENIAPETAAVEREVVRNELRVRGETGFIGSVLSSTQKALFPQEHPYSRPVVGTHESLSAIGLEDARAFVKAHYRPDNTTIVIVGDVDLAAVAKAIEDALPAEVKAGSAPKPDRPRLPPESPAPPAPPPGTLVRAQANVPTPELWIGWSLPRGYDVDSVLVQAVTRAARGVLPRAARFDGDIAGIGVMQIEGAEASMMLCRLVLHTADHPERSMEHVLDQLFRLWSIGSSGNDVQVGMQAASFQQFQRTIATTMLADAEDLLSRAQERALATHFAGDPLIYSRKLGAAMSLSAASVSDYANKHLTRERARAVLLTPLDSAGGAAVAGVPPDPTAESLPAPPDAETMRAFARPLGAASFTQLTLPNGLDVILAERRGLPIATVGLLFRKGEYPVFGAAELAEVTAYPKVTTKVVPGSFGATYWDRSSRDDQRYYMSGSSGNVNEMVSLLAEWVSGMTVTSEAVDGYFRDVLGARGVAENKAAALAERALWGGLYPGHIYGKTAVAADLRKLDAAAARDWIRATHVAKNGVLVVVGEIDVAQVEKAVASAFGDLPAGQPAALPAALAVTTDRNAPVPVARRGATQMEMSFGCRVSGPSSSLALSRLAATLLGNRVHDQLRRKLGASYGFHVHASALVDGTAHLLGKGAVDNAHAQQAVVILQEQLSLLASSPVDPAELDRARWARVLAYAVAYQSTNDIADDLLYMRGLGLPVSSLDSQIKDILDASPAAVAKQLQDCARAPVLVATGEEETVSSALSVTYKKK